MPASEETEGKPEPMTLGTAQATQQTLLQFKKWHEERKD